MKKSKKSTQSSTTTETSKDTCIYCISSIYHDALGYHICRKAEDKTVQVDLHQKGCEKFKTVVWTP